LVDLAEIQAAYYMVAATGVLVAAVYYVLNMRVTRRTQDLALKSQEQTLVTRQAQLFMPLYAYYSQTEFPRNLHNIYVKWKWTDPEDFFEKYGPEANMDAWSQVQSMGNYFRGVGVLLKDELVERRMVYDLLYSPIVMYWEKIESIAKEYRVKYNQPKAFMYIDFLYNEMMNFEKDNHDLKT
jgi:hypothetical protein